MKYLVLICVLCIQSYSLAFIDKVSLGLGSYSEHIGTIEESVGGETNGYAHDIYINSRLELNWVLFNWVSILGEAGFTFPRSSRDSAVSEINYWTTLLLAPSSSLLGVLRPHIGAGFLFTRLSMSGEPQDLTNAGAATTFQTPDGPSTAWNNIVVVGTDIEFTKNIYSSAQLYLTNIEDSEESTKTLLLSLNYNIGAP